MTGPMHWPAGPPPVPAIVVRFAAGRPVRAVWLNGLRGVTFRLGSDEFVKVDGSVGADFRPESRRLRWAADHLAVPPVRGVGRDDGLAWLRTGALPGVSAVHPRWLRSPQVAVRAIGVGLRTLHDALPVAACPFDWSVDSRLTAVPPERRAVLGPAPPIDRLVVCHGDACAPNTLIGPDGHCSGHVDFGELGLADRWADLAVAALSLGWNYPGRVWDAEFFAAYGVDPDPVRIDYYRRLWQASGSESR